MEMDDEIKERNVGNSLSSRAITINPASDPIKQEEAPRLKKSCQSLNPRSIFSLQLERVFELGLEVEGI